MSVKTLWKATDPLAETKRCHEETLQLYRQFASCLGAGIQDVFGPYKHSPHSQLCETFNAKLRTSWRDERETSYETFSVEKCGINLYLLTQISSTVSFSKPYEYIPHYPSLFLNIIFCIII
jgi:hypothetical protein